MRNLTCIVCPIGCSLDVMEDINSPGNISVTGNSCQRGIVYAKEEIRAPKRTVTATCAIESETCSVRRLPVKTTSACPKERIPELLCDIYKLKIPLPVKAGDIVIAGWNGSDINVVVTRTLGQ